MKQENLDEFVTGLKNNSHVVSVLFSFEALDCSEISLVYKSCHKSLPTSLDLRKRVLNLEHARILSDVLKEKECVLREIFIDWNSVEKREDIYKMFVLLYSTNNSCLEDRIDFTDLDAPTFENDDAANEPEAEELISCIESSTVLKYGYEHRRKQKGWVFMATNKFDKKNIPCLKRIVMIRRK